MKKTSVGKSGKSNSKLMIKEFPNNPQLATVPIESTLKSEVNRLEKIIKEQSEARQKNQKEILALIQHLDATKKSKLVTKPNFTRFLSPSKSEINHQKETQEEMRQYKKLLTTIKSETEIELNENNSRIDNLGEQIQKMKNKINFFETVEMNVCHLNQEFISFKQIILQKLNQNEQMILKNNCEKINKLEKQNDEIKQQLSSLHQSQQNLQPLKIKQKIDQMQIEIKTIYNQISTTIFQLEDKLKQHFGTAIAIQNNAQIKSMQKHDKQIDDKVMMLQNCVQVCLEVLKGVQQQSQISFENLEQKIKQASSSIIQTKQSIEQSFYGSKQKFSSQSSLDCTQQSQPARRPNETNEKINYLQSRMKRLENRTDTIYNEYLTRPFLKQNFD